MMPNLKDRAVAKRSKRREELIGIVKESSIACGRALMELRDDEHWRETHTSFYQFCEETFQIKSNSLWKMLKSVEVIDSLPNVLRGTIKNVAQAIALTYVPEADRTAVVAETFNHGDVTAKTLTAAHQRLKKAAPDVSPISKPEPVRDDLGTVIPMEALPYWDRVGEIKSLIKTLDDVRETIELGQKGLDPMFSKVPSVVIKHIYESKTDLEKAVLYAVCHICRGEPSLRPDGCSVCANMGLISKSEHEKYHKTALGPVSESVQPEVASPVGH